MSFFYNLNKRLADLAAKQDATQMAESKQAESVAQSPLTQALNEAKAQKVPGMQVTHKDIEKHFSGSPLKWAQAASDAGFSSGRINQTLDNLKHGKNPNDIEEAGYSAKAGRAGKDLGKPGKNFAKIAKGASERYGSKAAGERVAGAVLNKLRHPKEAVENEGNEFTGNLAKAKAQHKDEFEVDGKKYKVVEADPTGLGESTCNECGMYESRCKCPGVEEGNAFTGALAKTPKGGKFKVGNKEFTDTSSLEEQEMDEGYAEMDAWLKSREKEKGTGRYDKRKVSTGTVYTRKPETFDDPETDPEATGGAPKRKGRPAGTRRAIGAKHSGTSKLARKDAIAEGDNSKLQDELRELRRISQMVQTGKADFPKGFASHLESVLYAAMTALGQQQVQEKAVSVAQRRAAGIAHAAQKGEIPKSKLRGASKEMAKMDKSELHKYAATKEKGLPKHVEEESTDKEDTKAEKAGRKVAKDIEHDEGHKGRDDAKAEKAGKKVTKDIEYDDKKDKEEKVDETSDAPKSSKGMQFGKGVYESLDAKLETMISEGMNVSVNMNSDAEGDAQKSITVTATGADADKLAELLKMAGLESKKETCPGCGSSDCDCDAEVVDENSPDWPTNKDTLAAEPNLRTYSGGLNGPKSTGQTTTPVIASQLRRQTSMEENVELERSLFKTWSNYKG